jgi:hypothetical protein
VTTEHTYAGGDPQNLLAHSRELAHRVRQAQRATWFPLSVLALVTFAAVPIDRYGAYATTCKAVPTAGLGGEACTTYSTASLVYWPVALVLAYTAIAAFYVRASRARGVGTRVRPYVIAGVVLAVLATCVALRAAHNPPIGTHDILGLHFRAQSSGVAYRLVGASSAIGVALVVLAWAERTRALLVLAVVYLIVVLVPVNFGWAMQHPWSFVPHLVIDGGLLALGAVGFAIAQRPRRSHAP